MNRELKENARKLCEQIKNLTNELDNNIKSIEETNFLFENSTVYNTNISEGDGSPVNGLYKIVKSKFIESKINLPSANVVAHKSIFKSPNLSENYISIGNTDSIYNSLFYGFSISKDIDALKISGRAGYNVGGNTKIKKNTSLQK